MTAGALTGDAERTISPARGHGGGLGRKRGGGHVASFLAVNPICNVEKARMMRVRTIDNAAP